MSHAYIASITLAGQLINIAKKLFNTWDDDVFMITGYLANPALDWDDALLTSQLKYALEAIRKGITIVDAISMGADPVTAANAALEASNYKQLLAAEAARVHAWAIVLEVSELKTSNLDVDQKKTIRDMAAKVRTNAIQPLTEFVNAISNLIAPPPPPPSSVPPPPSSSSTPPVPSSSSSSSASSSPSASPTSTAPSSPRTVPIPTAPSIAPFTPRVPTPSSTPGGGATPSSTPPVTPRGPPVVHGSTPPPTQPRPATPPPPPPAPVAIAHQPPYALPDLAHLARDLYAKREDIWVAQESAYRAAQQQAKKDAGKDADECMARVIGAIRDAEAANTIQLVPGTRDELRVPFPGMGALSLLVASCMVPLQEKLARLHKIRIMRMINAAIIIKPVTAV